MSLLPWQQEISYQLIILKAVLGLPFFSLTYPIFLKYLCDVKHHWVLSLLVAALPLLTSSCRESVDVSVLQVYDGPVKSALNIHLMQSDSAILRSEISAAKQLEFATGDLEFPEGIEIKMYEKSGELGTIIRADKGYFIRSKNLYKGVGNVQVENLIEDQKLQSEELFWNQREKKIYTEKFVTIQDKQTIFNGTGMEADDSFKEYEIKHPTGKTPLPGDS